MKATRKIVPFSIAGLVAVAAVGFTGGGAAQAVDQPVTFEVTNGTLTIAQTASTTLLVEGTAVEMPETTVRDGNAATNRTGAWTVSASVSNLTGVVGSAAAGATILAAELTLDEVGLYDAAGEVGTDNGGFTYGTGTRVGADPVVGSGVLVSATGESINSVFTYTPTVLLAAQTDINAGSYEGVVTQTVT